MHLSLAWGAETWLLLTQASTNPETNPGERITE